MDDKTMTIDDDGSGNGAVADAAAATDAATAANVSTTGGVVQASESLSKGATPVDESIRKRPIPRDWVARLLKRFPTPANCASDTKALVVAPMVDQSDLPYRLLCRRYGANLAFTPMIHARLFQTSKAYRRKFFDLANGTPPEDRPLIAQLCGSRPLDCVVQTAKDLEPFVDGIDLNCGCPQNIAKKGHYGAFLLEQEEELVDVVKALTSAVQIPVSVKARLLPSGVEDSIELYRRLIEEGGISLLTIHGRTRLQKAALTGQADWDTIKRAVQLFGDRIPIFANGSIGSLQDAKDCLEYTGADGIMSSEAILEYPPLFSSNPQRVSRLHLARQYLELAKEYPTDQGGQGSGMKCIRVHLHRFLHADLQRHTEIRDMVIRSFSLEAFEEALDRLEQIHTETNHNVATEQLSWYVRHRRIVDETTGMTSIEAQQERERNGCVKTRGATDKSSNNDDEDYEDGEVCDATCGNNDGDDDDDADDAEEEGAQFGANLFMQQ